MNPIKEMLEDCSQMIRDSVKRKQSWEVVRTDRKKQVLYPFELARQQERELPVAAGAENKVLHCESMRKWEREP